MTANGNNNLKPQTALKYGLTDSFGFLFSMLQTVTYVHDVRSSFWLFG